MGTKQEPNTGYTRIVVNALGEIDFETRLAHAARIVTAADPAYYLVPGLDRTVGHRGELRRLRPRRRSRRPPRRGAGQVIPFRRPSDV